MEDNKIISNKLLKAVNKEPCQNKQTNKQKKPHKKPDGIIKLVGEGKYELNVSEFLVVEKYHIH